MINLKETIKTDNMKVKVVRSRDSNVWYHHRVGQTFDVDQTTDGSRYIVINPGKDYLFHILPRDCEVVSHDDNPTTRDTEPELIIPNVKTIKMSLDTARKMYNDVNRPMYLNSFLLENFTKEELEPKKGFTWEESFDGSGYSLNMSVPGTIIRATNQPPYRRSKGIFKTKEQLESALSFAQLTHIVAKYNEGKKAKTNSFAIACNSLGEQPLHVVMLSFGSDVPHLLFYDIDDAKTSLEVNKDLWKQYWMIK